MRFITVVSPGIGSTEVEVVAPFFTGKVGTGTALALASLDIAGIMSTAADRLSASGLGRMTVGGLRGGAGSPDGEREEAPIALMG